jgi:hypothetical protein
MLVPRSSACRRTSVSSVGAAGAVESHWEDVLALQNCPFREVATDNNRCKMPQSGMRGRGAPLSTQGASAPSVRRSGSVLSNASQRLRRAKIPFSCPVTVMSMISDATLPSVPEPIDRGEHRFAIAAIPALALLLERHAYSRTRCPAIPTDSESPYHSEVN